MASVVRCLFWLGLAGGLSCGSGDEVAGTPTSGPPAELAGLWKVEGATVEKDNEASRRSISGTVVLSQQGDRYTSTFTMKTMLPTPEGASVDTDVIGKGEGEIQGHTLLGTAHTQLVMATVPGVDTGFAFVPRQVSTRIVSSVKGEVLRDGTLALEIESVPEPGQVYRPTRTRLTGRRAE
jgi:hypothetical protein